MNVRPIVAAASAAGIAVAALSLAPAAQAYDKDGYSYAAGHMIERSDIPKALGSFKSGLQFGASKGDRTLFICNQPQTDANAPEVEVKVPGPVYTYNANYLGRGSDEDAPFITVDVNQYANASRAIRAFDQLRSRIELCDGTSSNSWSNDDGTTTAYSTEVTHGAVPSVTTAGVESLFLSNNNLSETLPKGAVYISDSYTVYSLFGDTIIATAYYSNSTKNLTTAQRRAVNKVAFNAETRWAV
jgi:hypothetical protein